MMLDSGTFVKTLLPADGNNIVTILDFNQIFGSWKEYEAEYIVKHLIILEDFQAKIGLFSLLERGWLETNALASQSAENAALDKLKKEGQKVYLEVFHAYGNGPWQSKGEEILQNVNSLEQPWALMSPFFSTNETALLDSNLKVGVRIASKAQGIGGLKGNDYIRLFGSWRSNSSREKKKDDGVEALNARMAMLEALLEGMLSNLPANTLLGRGESPGSASIISSSQFATPEQITVAINTLVGDSYTALDTLSELGAALANDANFAATVTASLAAKLTKTSNLSDLDSKQTALNNLTGTQTANRVLRSDGTNTVFSQVNLVTDVTGVLPLANGGNNNAIAHTFKAGKTAHQTFANSTWTKITFATEISDSNNQYNPTTSRLTAINNETWNISPSVTVTLNVQSRLLLSIWKNGAEIAGSRYLDMVVNPGDFQLSSNVEFSLVANDYLEVYVLVIAGSPYIFGEPQMLATSWSGKRIK